MDSRWACLLLALSGLSFVKTDEECTISSDHCSCTTSDKKLTINLNHIGLSYPVTAMDQESKYRFSFMPCKPVVCEGSTGEPSVVCQRVLSQDVSYSLGRYTDMSWIITDTNPSTLKFEITYGGGDESRRTKITFSKESTKTAFTYVMEEKSTPTYVFQVSGSGVAPYSRSGHGGGNIAGPIGLAIIFIALGALAVYFVVGAIYMYFRKGARGWQMIPNYTFWKELPFFIKDGFFFTISPCYKRKEKYQSL